MNQDNDTPLNTVFYGVKTFDGGFVWGSNRYDVETYPTRAPNSDVVKTSWGKLRKTLQKALR